MGEVPLSLHYSNPPCLILIINRAGSLTAPLELRFTCTGRPLNRLVSADLFNTSGRSHSLPHLVPEVLTVAEWRQALLLELFLVRKALEDHRELDAFQYRWQRTPPARRSDLSYEE